MSARSHEELPLTIAAGEIGLPAPAEVYLPQEDSQLLIRAMSECGLAPGRRVADLCTGSGAVAVAAATAGARQVTAIDLCPRAVHHARRNAAAAGVRVAVHLGSWARAVEFGPFDLVVCNPPYVPSSDQGQDDSPGVPLLAYDGGEDGRVVLDPLCASAPALLDGGGTLMLVHSEFSDVGRTQTALHDNGMRARVVAEQVIPFGPVLTARAPWLERAGMVRSGTRVEKLFVIRADMR